MPRIDSLGDARVVPFPLGACSLPRTPCDAHCAQPVEQMTPVFSCRVRPTRNQAPFALPRERRSSDDGVFYFAHLASAHLLVALIDFLSPATSSLMSAHSAASRRLKDTKKKTKKHCDLKLRVKSERRLGKKSRLDYFPPSRRALSRLAFNQVDERN